MSSNNPNATSSTNGTKFEILASDGSNYLHWVADLKAYLRKEGVRQEVDDEDETRATDDKKTGEALHILRQHIHRDLRIEYQSEENPAKMFASLRTRFEKIASVMLPKAEREWVQLRVRDFKTIDAYVHKLNDVVARMKICGLGDLVGEEAIVRKTITTFYHGFNALTATWNRTPMTWNQLYSELLRWEQHENEYSNLDKLNPGPTKSVDPKLTEANLVDGARAKRYASCGQSRGRERGRGGRGRRQWRSDRSCPTPPRKHAEDQESKD